MTQALRDLQHALELGRVRDQGPCKECGGPVLIPTWQSRPNQKFCSRACSQKNYRHLMNARRAAGILACEVEGCDRDGRSRGLCPVHRKRVNVHGSTELPGLAPEAERFWSRVDKSDPDGCWLWKGYPPDHPKYGSFYRQDGTPIKAHRWSYEAAFGPVPDGMFVCHRCDHRPCVRPDHLFAGTQQENIADAVQKGRMSDRGNPKLTAEQVAELRRLRAAGWPRADLAERYGIHISTADRILTRKTWRSVA